MPCQMIVDTAAHREAGGGEPVDAEHVGDCDGVVGVIEGEVGEGYPAMPAMVEGDNAVTLVEGQNHRIPTQQSGGQHRMQQDDSRCVLGPESRRTSARSRADRASSGGQVPQRVGTHG